MNFYSHLHIDKKNKIWNISLVGIFDYITAVLGYENTKLCIEVCKYVVLIWLQICFFVVKIIVFRLLRK